MSVNKPGRRYGESQGQHDRRPRPDSNGRVLAQVNIDAALYDKGAVAAKALNISRSLFFAEVLRRLEVDRAGRPVGWEDFATPASGQLPLSA